MYDVRLNIDHTGTGLETLARFAFGAFERYCEAGGRIFLEDLEGYENVSVHFEDGPQALLDRAEAKGYTAGEISLPRFRVRRRGLNITMLRSSGTINVNSERGDEAFLEEVIRYFSEFKPEPSATYFSHYIMTLEDEQMKASYAAAPNPLWLFRAVHFLVGYRFRSGRPAETLEVKLGNPAKRYDHPIQPKNGVRRRSCPCCRIEHEEMLCDSLLRAPLSRIQDLEIQSPERELVRLSPGLVLLETRDLPSLLEAADRWKALERDAAFEARGKHQVQPRRVAPPAFPPDFDRLRKWYPARYMTVEDVAEYLKLSPDKIYRLARQGSIPVSKLGTRWRFKKAEIDQWMEGQEVSE